VFTVAGTTAGGIGILVLASIIQKLAIGVPLVPEGFVAPVVTGSILGLLLGLWMHRDRQNQQRLRRHAREATALNEELSRRERDLRSALSNREALLSEVHHRVRNNLQILSSLVSLERHMCSQARGAAVEGGAPGIPGPTDTAGRTHDALARRVTAIATVYDEIGALETPTHIRLRELLERVAQAAIPDDGARPQSLTVDCVETRIDVGRAVPIALLLSELVAASVETSFTGGAGGAIRIVVTPSPDRLIFEYFDDGAGIDTGEDDPGCGTNLGPMLIASLAEQLQAEMLPDETGGRHGTVFRARIPASLERPAAGADPAGAAAGA
jgi:two-component sensor histidine kinase